MFSASALPLNLETTKNFVQLTATKFGWGDLSEDTIMDIGCGQGLFCTRSILENFPNVKSILALDVKPTEIQGISIESPRVTIVLGDVTKREDIQPYQGKIDKAISTHVIHQIANKKKAFKNVYRLLKPGGHAAFLFTADMGLYYVLEALRSDEKYQDYYKGSELMNMYQEKLTTDDYREMLKKIGFEIVDISDDKEYFLNACFGFFENVLHKAVSNAFSVPSELVLDINNSASYIYQRKFCDQTSTYASTEMSIFVAKPMESSTHTSCSSS